jgi:tetratricopeptide (TPR) repeat protein
MKFPSYGLIISLSIFLFAQAAFPADKPDTAADNNLKSLIAQNYETKQPVENNNADNKQSIEQLSKQISVLNTQLELSTSSISYQINDIKQKQKDTLSMLQAMNAQYETSKSTFSTYENQLFALKKEQQDIMSLLMKLNESQEMLKDKINNISGTLAKADTSKTGVVISSSTKKLGLVPSSASVEELSGQQYIKLKLLEDGQEVELYLDPTYVDMNFAIPKNKKTDKSAKAETAKNETDIDKIMQYLSALNDKKTPQNQQAPQSQTITSTPSQPPSYNTYNITNPPQQGLQDNKNPDGSKKADKGESAAQDKTFGIDNPAIEDSQTLDDLLKAQKYFYEKKYNAALNSVQRSLAKQETALAYAIEGSIYFTIGEVDLAISSWEAALKLNPNMMEVRKVLAKYKR